MTILAPGTIVTRPGSEPGLWRVISIETRAYGPRDYLPLGSKIGDPRPAHAVLERIAGWDFAPSSLEARGQRPRRGGAPVAALHVVTRADLDAVMERVQALRALLPEDREEIG